MSIPRTFFKGVDDYGNSLIGEQLSTNLVEWAKWCFLGIGAFYNVRIPTSGGYGGDFSRLRPVQSPNYTQGRVWEGARQNWVWETGIQFRTQPIGISGVWVNGVFQSSGFVINYPLGQIVFNNAVSPSSVVKVEHSFRHVNIVSDNTPWFKQIMTDSFRPDSSQFLLLGSGSYSVLSQNRVQLPAVIVEMVPRFRHEGYEIGGGQTMYQDVAFWVLAQNAPDRNQIVDILRYQNEGTIVLFDRNLMGAQNRWPLSPSGNINPGATTYPTWVRPTGEGGLAFNTCRMNNVAGQDVDIAPNLFTGYVRFTTEVVNGRI